LAHDKLRNNAKEIINKGKKVEQIAIDGKAIRGSKNGEATCLQSVSAWQGNCMKFLMCRYKIFYCFNHSLKTDDFLFNFKDGIKGT